MGFGLGLGGSGSSSFFPFSSIFRSGDDRLGSGGSAPSAFLILLEALPRLKIFTSRPALDKKNDQT